MNAGPPTLSECTTRRATLPSAWSVSREAEVGLIGRALGSFRILRRIGKGRMSTVYLAEHLTIGSQVAIKLLNPHLAADPWMVARFYAEARALCLAAHENIVSVFDTGSAGPDQHYLMMELLDGRPLSALVATRPVPPEVVVPILAQICDALEAGHRRGLVHRDLRPENIFLIRRARSEHFVKLLDFGAAALSSPEAAQPPTAPADGRTDLYTLGIIAQRLLAGGGSVELSRALACAVAERLEERFRTAEDFKAALLAAVPGREPAASSGPPEHRAAASASTSPTPPSAPMEPRTPPARPRLVSSDLREPDRSTPPSLRVSGVFRDGSGREWGPLRCIHLTRAGLFACLEAPPPPFFSRLSLVLRAEGGELTCAVEVVRHVDAAQGKSWGMPPGFGVQFVEPSPAFREALASLGARSREFPAAPPAGPAPAVRDDSRAEPLLAGMLARSATEPYAFLSLPRDVSMSDARRRAREEQQRLQALRDRPLSTRQLERLEKCLRRVSWALGLLGEPARRAELDARLGNFQGVARCIAAGLPPSELDACRRRYLAANRAAETRALVHALTARSFEGQGEVEKALAQYEGALTHDPLNMDLHREYWALKHRAAGQARCAPPGP